MQTYLPDYSLNMTVGATVAPAMIQQQYLIQGQMQQQPPPGCMLPQQQPQLSFNHRGFHENFVMQSAGSAAAVSNSSPIMHSTLQQTQQQYNSPQFRTQIMGGPVNQISGVGGGGGSNSTSPPHSFSSSPNQQNNQLIAPISGAINPNFMSVASNGNLKKTSSLFDRM